jgi:hypothetical protein
MTSTDKHEHILHNLLNISLFLNVYIRIFKI